MWTFFIKKITVGLQIIHTNRFWMHLEPEILLLGCCNQSCNQSMDRVLKQTVDISQLARKPRMPYNLLYTKSVDSVAIWSSGQWLAGQGVLTRYVILRVVHAPGMPGTVSRHRLQRKPLVSSDPGMHHGTCVTHVPWCMSGSLTRGDGEKFPGIPGACTTRNFTYLARGPSQNKTAIWAWHTPKLLGPERVPN